jgi:ATP-dependent Clp protease ATP-binding subunit ClpA
MKRYFQLSRPEGHGKDSVHTDRYGRQEVEGINGIGLEVSKKAVEFIAREGFDPVYGARPLKRLIQKKVVDRLALMLLERSVKAGDSLKADVKAGELSLTAAAS